MNERYQKGMQKGRQEGKQEGMQQGMQQGVEQTCQAFHMLLVGDDCKTVAQATGLSFDTIKNLQKELSD